MSLLQVLTACCPLLLHTEKTQVPGKGNKRLRFHASLTASESSTIAEEVVVLLRRLHSLSAWNHLINQFISSSLQDIPSIIVPSGSHMGGVALDAGEIQVQVG